MNKAQEKDILLLRNLKGAKGNAATVEKVLQRNRSGKAREPLHLPAKRRTLPLEER